MKEGYIWSQDIIDYILIPAIHEKLGVKKQTILIQTAHCWLKKLNWCYDCKKNGMYIDGHEREDVGVFAKPHTPKLTGNLHGFGYKHMAKN